MNVRIDREQVRDALNTSEQSGVGRAERIHDADGAVVEFKKSVVRNDDERVDLFAQIVDAQRCRGGTLRAFEGERTSDDCNGERAVLACCAGDW